MRALRSPSIVGRRLLIPLALWFSRDSGCALPLLALDKSEVQLVVTLRPVAELYTVIEPRALAEGYGERGSPLRDYAALGLHPFTMPPGERAAVPLLQRNCTS